MINNKKIIITGAASGIGLELCKILSKNNTVFAVDINEIPNIPNIISYNCDLSQKNNIDDMLKEAVEKLTDIDMFFSNAGFAYCEYNIKPDWNHIDKIFKTNVFSSIYLLNKIREIKKEKEFNFIITASAMSFLSMPGYSLYSGTKFALKGFADAARFDLKKGQTLNMVYPIATTETNFFNNAKTNKVPWPSQTANVVAEKIIKGVLENKKHIFPSKLYQIMHFINKFLPIFTIYIKIERRKMKKLKENENKSL